MARVGEVLPNFEADSQLGALSLHDYIEGQWAVLCVFARDFCPFSTTEIGMLAKMYDEFDQRGCRLLALSIGSAREHEVWLDDVRETQGVRLQFPLLVDEGGSLSRLLGTLAKHQGTIARPLPEVSLADIPASVDDGEQKVQTGVTVNPLRSRFATGAAAAPSTPTPAATRPRVRAPDPHGIRGMQNTPCVIVVDPAKVVVSLLWHPYGTGRNFYEVVRLLDGVVVTSHYPVHTPAHWCYGDDVYVAPGVADEEAMALLPRGFSEASHYMRTTATPDH